MSKFSSDQALPPNGKDLFNRKPYAKKIASEIVNQPIAESYTIGLFSPWGYGKTSALNMIIAEIGEDALIVKFNPWIYSSQQAMVRGLLTQIMSKVYRESLKKEGNDPDAENWFKKAYNSRTLNGALSKKETLGGVLNDYAELTGLFDSKVGKGAKVIGNLLAKDPLSKLRKTVETKIVELGKRVIVIIDDVDRLDESEMFEIFKSVKVIADFKGITYIVSFDDIQVAEALNSRFSNGKDPEAGRKYLEKIIQIPLQLPKIEQETLDEILFDEITNTLHEHNIEISEEDEDIFKLIYEETISKLIRTPRNVYRYLNAIKFTIPIVGDEVNAIDHLITEALRVFYPHQYSKVSSNKLLLTGNRRDYFIDREDWDNEAKEKINLIADNDDNVVNILKSLFPYVRNLFQTSKDRLDKEEFRRRKFIASEDYFDRYFTYGVGKVDIADSQIVEIVNQDDVERISSELESLLNDKDQTKLLAKLRTYSVGAKDPLALVKSILRVGKKFSNDTKGMFRYSPIQESTDIIEEILSKSKDKVNDYIEVINVADNLDQLTYIIRDVISGSEIKDSKDPILNQSELEKFKKAALSRIKSLSETTNFHESNNTVAYHLYYYWSQFGSRDETESYLLNKIKNTDDVLNFLTKNLSVWTSGRGSHRGNLDRTVIKNIDKIIDSDKLYQIIKKEMDSIPDVDEYPDLEHAENNISKVGNENSSEFRSILLNQFIYIKEHPIVESD